MQQLVYRDGRLIATEDLQKDEEAVYGGYDDDGDISGPIFD